jgi:hypothetical protein
MKGTLWQKKKVIIYMGGNPAKNEAPVLTLELDNPQIQFDSNTNTIIIFENQ